MDTKHSKIPARRSPCLADLPYLAKDVDISTLYIIKFTPVAQADTCSAVHNIKY